MDLSIEIVVMKVIIALCQSGMETVYVTVCRIGCAIIVVIVWTMLDGNQLDSAII
tara:strand:+ start:15 stop:179 length:165 start_codon:yes stop_codon:yes gene_type:complete